MTLRKIWRLPIVPSSIALLAMLALTQYLTYQRYLTRQRLEHEVLLSELSSAGNSIRSVLYNNITAANALVVLYQGDGAKRSFNSVARQLVHNSKYVDAVVLSENGGRTHKYPGNGREKNPVADKISDTAGIDSEAAGNVNDVGFSGPMEIRLGSDGILGKLPIMIDGKLKGHVVVVSNMSTIRHAFNLEDTNKRIFAYTLSRSGSEQSDSTTFLMTKFAPKPDGRPVSSIIPEGNWVLSVAYNTAYTGKSFPVELAILGVLLSITIAGVVYRKVKEPHELRKIIAAKTEKLEATAAELRERVYELSTLYEINRILQREDQSEEATFAKIADLLPAGWQSLKKCAVKIVFDGTVYQSPDYRESEYKQVAPIQLLDGRSGEIEVVCLEEDLSDAEGPFSNTERHLIQAISTTIQVYLNKRSHQQELSKSEANLTSIFETTDIGYALLDLDFNILSINNYLKDRCYEQTGIVVNVGDNFVKSLIEEKQEPAEKLYRKAIEDKTKIEYEAIYTKDGQPSHYWVSVAPVESDRQIIGLCLALIEITRIRSLEREREKIIRDLTQRNIDLEQFAQIVSHNLRGPLSIILGVNLMLEEPMPEAEKDSLIDEIRLASKRLDTVIMDLNQVLQVRREISEAKVLVNLEDLVGEVTQSVSNMVRHSNAHIDYDFSAATELSTVRSYMNSIFYNLITNSIKYAQPDKRPQMKLWTRHNEDSITIFHKDNGIGIDLEKHSNKVFQLYQRFHLSAEGKGLGLFMTKTQVEALGGKIALESAPGEGCLFSITLPV